MKVGKLRAIAHSIADSLGSGCGLLVGVYDLDVYGEAKKNPDGVVAVDFLAAEVIHGKVSRALASAIRKYGAALPILCDSNVPRLSAVDPWTSSLSPAACALTDHDVHPQ
jgi:hypothetical protein